ncbi:MAG: xanthine dehydrogenase small subunit [Pseudomonadota bacterium]
MGKAISFLLGDAERHLDSVDPNLTVLRYLREVEGLTGTKEGCAEGDCGACTVVLGESNGERMHYRAVNACILFTPALDGKQLIAIEHLKGADDRLHPAQDAMVQTHGTQCGFCTPGFIMSLFALYEEPGAPDRARIDDTLAGNLCRCTGYGPIVKAARDMKSLEPNTPACVKPGIARQLDRLSDGDGLAFESKDGRFFAPRTADELADLLLAHPKATILSGGTDVGLWVTKALRHLDPVIHTGQVAELKELRQFDDHLEIGAAVTYEDAHEVIAQHFPDFGEVIRRLGCRQVRNVGTIGGNIGNGSPIGDSPPPLIALGARLVLRRGAERREIALEDYFIDYGKQDRQPGEFIERIIMPLETAAGELRCYKISKRFDQDISAVLGAFNLRITDGRVERARICYGGMAGTPKRALACEAALTGQPWTLETVQQGRVALDSDFTPMSDQRASAGYRMLVAKNLLTKVYHETNDAPPVSRLVGAGSLAHG